MGIAALGSFAGGLASGMERGQIMADRAQESRYRKTLMDAERQQRDAVEQARAAAAEVLKADAAAYQQRLGATAGKQLGDSISVATAATGATEPADVATLGAAVPAAPAQPKPYVPDDMVKLKAATAFSDKLLELGRVEDAAKAWGLAESRRAALRGKAAQGLLAAVATGGDIAPQLKQFYDLVDDGHDIASVEVTAGSDGKPAYRVTRVNKATGQALPPTVSSPAQIEESVARMVSDPATLAKHAWEQKLALYKSDLEMGQIRERGAQDRTTAGVKANYEIGVEREKGRIRLGEIGAKGAEDRKTEAAKADAPFTLADGATRYETVPQPDGTKKRVPVAGGPKAGGDKKDALLDQIHDEIARAYGEPSQGLLGGNRTSNPMTSQAALYARDLMASDPSITMTDAIREAVKEMKKRQQPKQ